MRRHLTSLFALLLCCLSTTVLAAPTFDCSKTSASIETLICEDTELTALDHKLAEVYKAALRKATREHPPVLKASQRGWVKGRNDCWKRDDKRSCAKELYVRRIAELQASYRLVAASAPVIYVCNGKTADQVIATYFDTEPATLIAERGDSTSLMYQAAAASGTRYVGRNEFLWEHQGEATIQWGYGAPEMRCRVADGASK